MYVFYTSLVIIPFFMFFLNVFLRTTWTIGKWSSPFREPEMCTAFAPRRCWSSSGAKRQIICKRRTSNELCGGWVVLVWQCGGRKCAVESVSRSRREETLRAIRWQSPITRYKEEDYDGRAPHSLGANRSSLWKTCVSSHILSGLGWSPHREDLTHRPRKREMKSMREALSTWLIELTLFKVHSTAESTPFTHSLI